MFISQIWRPNDLKSFRAKERKCQISEIRFISLN